MTATVKVWDPLIRVFHWSLVLSFAVAWLSADEWDDLHIWAGYAAAALVALRVLWGLLGPRYARFQWFVRSPATVLSYLSDLLHGREKRYLGHNPAGGAMIVAMILVLIGVSLTGWMYTIDAFWGVEWVEDAHEILANLLLALVGFHIVGVVVTGLRHHENLVWAMITGRKRVGESHDVT